jgi:hypothetical protein
MNLLQFLKQFSCYDLMPVSGKQIVLDKHLPVKKAFLALFQHGTAHDDVF